MINIKDYLVLLGYLIFAGKSIKTKTALSKALVFVSQSRFALKTVKDIANKGQYHFIGYDLSLLGMAIITYLNQLQVSNGRIQNGAPNYCLAGYSEVKDMFCWDEYTANAYRNGGYRGNATVSGNVLLYDKLTSSHPLPDEWQLDDHVGLSFFVAFSGPGHNTSVEGHTASIELLMRFIQMAKGSAFYLKLHPKDKLFYYNSILDFPEVRLVKDEFGLNAIDLLKVCDVVITGASSVALDALSMEKKVISIDPLTELSHFEFLNNTGVYKLSNVDGIIDAISWSEILEGEKSDMDTQGISMKDPLDSILAGII